MEENKLIIIIVIVYFGINILSQFIFSWLKNFFDTKAKNLATKQDIEAITHKIESVKFSINKELEILKINHAEIQMKKIELFEKLGSLFNDILNKRANPKSIVQELSKLQMNILTYCSENLIKQYLNFRNVSQQTENSNKNIAILKSFAVFFIALRTDLGYKDELKYDDVLNVLLNDWENHKQLYSNQVLDDIPISKIHKN